MKRFLLVVFTISIIFAIPQEITFQGKLANDVGTLYDGDYSTTFEIYDLLSGGTLLWTEVQVITYEAGLFHVYLGSVDTLPISIFDGSAMYLGMNVGGDVIEPRRKLVTVPYAFYAEQVNFDTLGAYLDSTFAGLVSHIDSVRHIDSISVIDSIAYIDFVHYIDSISRIDSISVIDSIGFIDYIDYIDSIGWVGHTVWADSAHWAGAVHWDSIIGIPGDIGGDADWNVVGINMEAIPVGNVGIGVTADVENKLHVVSVGAATSRAVYGEYTTTGPQGWLGTQLYGAYGQFNSSNYGALGSNGIGIYARGATNAGYFEGTVHVTGNISTDANVLFDSDGQIIVDGDSGSNDVLMSDGSGNLYWGSAAVGDDWGSQVAETDATIAGDGVLGTPLFIARQGASTNQVLKWDGSTWFPADDLTGSGGDNWGSAVVISDARLTGNGTVGSPLDIAQNGATTNQVLKWNGSSWSPSTDLTGSGGDDWGSDFVNSTARFSGNGTSGSLLELASQGASTNQVLKWSGSAWLPADDVIGTGDITAVNAGTGLVGGGAAGAVTLSFNTVWADGIYVNEGQVSSITSSMITNGTIQSIDILDGTCLTEISDDDGSGSGLDADLLDGLDSSDFSASGHHHCDENWVCGDSGLYITATAGYALLGITNDSTFAGVRGEGDTRSAGVVGTSSFTNAAGVIGLGSGTDGVYGYSDALYGSGVFGITDTIGRGVLGYTTGRGAGVYGLSGGYSGSWFTNVGVEGLGKNIGGAFVADTSAFGWGAFAQTSSINGIGLRVRSLANTNVGYNYAISATCSTGYFENASDSVTGIGYAVRAVNYDDAGTAIFAAKGDLDEFTILEGGAAINANADDVAIYGFSANKAILAKTDAASATAIHGTSEHVTGTGVFGSNNDIGLFTATDGVGVIGFSDNVGVWGRGDDTDGSFGVQGSSDHEINGIGVGGFGRYGVYAYGNSSTVIDYGIYARCEDETNDWAGYFVGDVRVSADLYVVGNLNKGTGSFLIDHPDDPENKTLRHNFVESPENLCIYRGKIQLDEDGEAIVEMPDYYKSLTKEDEGTVILASVGKPFLTGYQWSQDFLSVTIFGDSNREVSYMIMADRDDPVAKFNHRGIVEVKGSAGSKLSKGEYLNPQAYGQPLSKGMGYSSTIEPKQSTKSQSIEKSQKIAKDLGMDDKLIDKSVEVEEINPSNNFAR